MQNKQTERLLVALEMGLLDPDIRRSPTQLADLIADDFVEFGSSGKIYNKENIIAALLNETDADITARNASDFITRWIADDTALVTYRIKRTKKSKNTETIRASIWKYRGTRWQIIFHQGTIIL